jgi:hypothetical protein
VTQKSILIMIMVILISSALVSACSPARTPADTIADYLEALAGNDQTGAVSNSCAAWEENALSEGASFVNVEVTLEDLDCQVLSQSDTEATVSCAGRFLFSYDAGEEQELDLSGRNFSLVLESGEWRMCGYTK